MPGRWPGVLLLLPLFTVTPLRPEPGAARVTLLDVGQGLAAVVQTRHHTLVYDTGPGFGPAFDAGSAVLVPFLRQQGVRDLDRLIISHGDNDHIGGAESLLRAYPATRIFSSVPDKLPGNTVSYCRQGQRWNRDGVEFQMLHPGHEIGQTGNNASCVLHIEAAGGHRLLLTGDIESAAEYRLLRGHADALSAEVLVVPHHGSKTSSMPAFVRAVAPKIAVFPAGHLNRFRFPDRQVVARYAATGATLYQTGESGAVDITLAADTVAPAVSLYRERHPRYWSPVD
jgi:competence protein ComEC